MEWLQLSYTVEKIQNDAAGLENNWTVPGEIKHVIVMCPRNVNIMYLFSTNKN